MWLMSLGQGKDSTQSPVESWSPPLHGLPGLLLTDSSLGGIRSPQGVLFFQEIKQLTPPPLL